MSRLRTAPSLRSRSAAVRQDGAGVLHAGEQRLGIIMRSLRRLPGGEEPTELLHRRGQGFEVPCSQKPPLRRTSTISAHKIGGPKGIGALYIGPGSGIQPLLAGGGQESGLRAGTEATAQIAGFARAVSCGGKIWRRNSSAWRKSGTMPQSGCHLPDLKIRPPRRRASSPLGLSLKYCHQ